MKISLNFNGSDTINPLFSPSHKSAVEVTAIQETGFELLEHSPYSPDLAPRLKGYLRGKKFKVYNEVMSAVERFSYGQDKEFFSKEILDLTKEGLIVLTC